MCFLGGVLHIDLLAFLDIFLEVTSVLGLLDLDLELQDEDDDDELLEDEVLLLLRTLLTDPLLPFFLGSSFFIFIFLLTLDLEFGGSVSFTTSIEGDLVLVLSSVLTWSNFSKRSPLTLIENPLPTSWLTPLSTCGLSS